MAAAATLRTVLIVFVVVFCGRAACGVLPWHGRSDTASHLVRPSSCLLRLRGGNTSTDVSKAQGGGTHNKEENVVPLDEALKEHQELSEAMGLMTDLDKEIEAAQSKVMELEDSSGLTDEDRNRVRGILASKEMAAAESMQALPVMDRVHALEKIKNEIEVPAHTAQCACVCLRARIPACRCVWGHACSVHKDTIVITSIVCGGWHGQAAIDKQMHDLAAMGAPGV